MRNHGAVYRKLKEVKYRHLTNLYRKFFRKMPENCRYNHKHEFMSDGQVKEIRLCILHGINPELIDLCDQLHHCSRCDGFIFKYTKEDIKKLFEQELSDKEIREKKYPEICALEWVLERSIPGPFFLTWPQALYYSIKRAIFKNNLL